MRRKFAFCTERNLSLTTVDDKWILKEVLGDYKKVDNCRSGHSKWCDLCWEIFNFLKISIKYCKNCVQTRTKFSIFLKPREVWAWHQRQIKLFLKRSQAQSSSVRSFHSSKHFSRFQSTFLTHIQKIPSGMKNKQQKLIKCKKGLLYFSYHSHRNWFRQLAGSRHAMRIFSTYGEVIRNTAR